ncbi:MAG: phenylalanine--tRNA ligase subunit beta, partial [Trichlorobacter sp.]|nr:phenylalanine--tRNA ligase subunit beta [Trichlorobacter sp.]
YEIERSVYYFELNFEELVRLSGARKAITPPSRFPDSVRDLALLVPLDLASGQLIDCVTSVKQKELEDVAIFDLYQGDRVPEGHKSIALRLRYRAADRTMTDDEVQQVHQKIIASLTERLGVSVR